jgi:hypothetical protein
MAPVLGNPLMDFGQALTERPASELVQGMGFLP